MLVARHFRVITLFINYSIVIVNELISVISRLFNFTGYIVFETIKFSFIFCFKQAIPINEIDRIVETISVG